MRVSFVDVPLQNLESVWIGLDSGHYAKRVVLEVSYGKVNGYMLIVSLSCFQLSVNLSSL